MGQIDHQIVLALFSLPGGSGIPQRPLPGGVELVFQIVKGIRQDDGRLPRLGKLFGCTGQGFHLLYGSGNEVIADSHPAQ